VLKLKIDKIEKEFKFVLTEQILSRIQAQQEIVLDGNDNVVPDSKAVSKHRRV
jgi:hypothetical protein